jgi:outer membrane biosynthesis protein TonB
MAAHKISDKDLRSLRDRMKVALRQVGKTGREVEEAAGLSSGSLTRIYGGRRKLDFDLLCALAAEVEAEPLSLLTKGAQKVFADEIEVWQASTAADESKPGPGSAPEPAPAPEAASEPKRTSKPAPTPEPKPAAQRAPTPEAKPAPQPAPTPEPWTTHSPADDPTPRKRKRDLPARVARRVWAGVRGVLGL